MWLISDLGQKRDMMIMGYFVIPEARTLFKTKVMSKRLTNKLKRFSLAKDVKI